MVSIESQLTFEPDATQMRRHVGHLFEGWLNGCHEGRIELAWRNAEDGRLRHAMTFGTDELDELVERAVEENAKPGQNVYIGQALRQPNVAPSRRGSDADFLALTAFYVDIDDDVTAKAKSIYLECNCRPTRVVVTGRHPHVRAQMLWRLEEPVRDAETCRQQNIALARALGGDPSVVNAGRVLRLGGSIAWPTKEGRVTERTEFIDFQDGRPNIYFAEQIARAFPPGSSTQTADAPVTATAALRDNETPPTLNIGASGVSVETCIAAIRAGDQWHNNMLRLVGHWISRGWPDVEILTAAEAMTLTGYTIDATRREVSQMIMGGRSRWNVPNPDAWLEPPREAISLQPEFLDGLDLGSLPSRRWILGRALLRGHLSLLVAPAGVGKSTHGIARAVAIATGRDLTGEVVHEPVRTWIYNAEDDDDELKRRLGAVLQHHAVPFDDIRGRLALNSGADRPLLFARADRKELVIRQPDVDACIAQIREHDIGLFVVDPFIETHEVDENSNRQIKIVAGMYREVARSANCAVLLVHHTAKPPQGSSDGHAGNMNTARGASALVGVARVVETLFPMSERDAEEVGVSDNDRHLYLRLDGAKANLGPTRSEPAWYRRQSVTIANGDEVGVLVPHEFPLFGALSVVTAERTRAIFEEIERRWEEGEPFSSSANSDRCILPYLESQGLKKKVAKKALASWLVTQMLRSEVFNTNKKAKGLRVAKWPE